MAHGSETHHRGSLPLRGRESHLAQVRKHLDEMSRTGRSTVLVLQGPAGSGKTRLLTEALAVAAEAGVANVDGVADAPGRVAHGIEAARLQLSRNSARVPTVVGLDDLHTADSTGLATLRQLILAGLESPLLWLLAGTVEDGGVPPEPLRGFLARLSDVSVDRIERLEPLSESALADLVADHVGASPESALLALACDIGGAPGGVIELVRGLAQDGDIEYADGVARLRVDGSTDASAEQHGSLLPRPVPPRFAALIGDRLAATSRSTLNVLKVAAVLGSPFSPRDLLAMLDEPPVVLLTAMDEAVNCGLLICAGKDFAFRSGAVWRAVHDTVPAPMLTLLHRQAADTLLSRSGGQGRAAYHLVHVVEAENIDELQVIGDGAQELLADDPSTAARLMTRCLALLAPGRRERLPFARTAVDALTSEGLLNEAVALAEGVIDEGAGAAASGSATPDESEFAALYASLASALLLRGDMASARGKACHALTQLSGSVRDPDAVVAGVAASVLSNEETADEWTREILETPDRYTRRERVGAMTSHAYERWRDGHVSEAMAVLRDAAALDRGDGPDPLLDPRWFLAVGLVRIGEYGEADSVVRQIAHRASTTARTLAADVPHMLEALLHLARGRVTEAEAVAWRSVGTDRSVAPLLAPQAWLVLATAALRRGALQQAARHLEALEEQSRQDPGTPWWTAWLLLKARLGAARGESGAVDELLRWIVENEESVVDLVLEDSTAAAWCVGAALAEGRTDVVRTVLATTGRLRERNPDIDSVLAADVHARALADRDPEALAYAVDRHRDPWARATVIESRGDLLLECGEQPRAVDEYNRALDAFAALGGKWDAARVRATLRWLGVRRRHWVRTDRPSTGWGSLTETERQVAKLVAEDLTNRQVARQMFISPHTVGFHLRQIYRKLDIRSRTALVRFTEGV